MRKGLDALRRRTAGATDLVDDPRRADFLRRAAQRHRLSALRRTTGRCASTPSRNTRATCCRTASASRSAATASGRGFEVAEIAGDRGVGAKLELRRDLSTPSRCSGASRRTASTISAPPGSRIGPGRESAATAGTGFAISGQSLTGYLEVAAPLTGPDIEGKRRPRCSPSSATASRHARDQRAPRIPCALSAWISSQRNGYNVSSRQTTINRGRVMPNTYKKNRSTAWAVSRSSRARGGRKVRRAASSCCCMASIRTAATTSGPRNSC